MCKLKREFYFFRAFRFALTVSFFLICPALSSQTNNEIETLLDQLAFEKNSNGAEIIRKKIWLLWLDDYKNPKNKLKVDRALKLFNGGDLENADRAFSEIVKLEPEYVEGWNKRATLKFLLGDFIGSLNDIQEVLKRQPRHFGAISGSGLIHMHNGDFEDAYASYKKLFKIDPLNEDSKRFLPVLENKIFGKSL